MQRLKMPRTVEEILDEFCGEYHFISKNNNTLWFSESEVLEIQKELNELFIKHLSKSCKDEEYYVDSNIHPDDSRTPQVNSAQSKRRGDVSGCSKSLQDNIALCHACNCMTHTKPGKVYICAKCGKDRRHKR